MIKKAIIEYKTRKLLKRRSEQPMTDFASSQKIAIIYSDLFENEANIDDVVKKLKSEGKEISILVFCHNIKKKTTDLPNFHSGDISFSGDIKNEKLDFFLKQNYDFAICFDQSRHYLIDFVFAHLKAKCRVGVMTPARDHLFEMMVHSTDQSIPISGEILRYLKMIQPYG